MDIAHDDAGKLEEIADVLTLLTQSLILCESTLRNLLAEPPPPQAPLRLVGREGGVEE